MNFLVDLGFMFLGVGIMKAFVEPLAEHWARKKINQYGPVVYTYLDLMLPRLFGELDGAELQAKFTADMQRLTGGKWTPSSKEVDLIVRDLDVRITADKSKV